MYTYVQRPGCKKENTATYVYIRAGSRTPTLAYVRPGLVYMAGSKRETSSSSCSWGGNRMRRVHGEVTECVVFMGRQRNASCSSGGNGTRGSQPAGSKQNAWSCSSGGLGRNRRWKRGLAYRTTEETALCSTGHVRNGILFIGRGVAYRKMEVVDLCWSAYGRNGVMFIGRGVAYRKMGLHGLLFIHD